MQSPWQQRMPGCCMGPRSVGVCLAPSHTAAAAADQSRILYILADPTIDVGQLYAEANAITKTQSHIPTRTVDRTQQRTQYSPYAQQAIPEKIYRLTVSRALGLYVR